jgi:membrane protease subunit HflK
VITEWVAGRTVDEVLIRGKRDLPDWVQEQTQKRIAGYQLGIRVQAASVAHLLPPERVKYAFDAVTKAQTAMHTTINRAHEQEARLLRDAEISRQRMDREAQADVNSTLQSAKTDAETYDKRRKVYDQLRRQNPNMLAAIWWDEMGRVFARLKENGRIDLLDSHLAGDGLDITTFQPNPSKTRR